MSEPFSGDPERMGRCANCRESFDLRLPYVMYGGFVWCTERCLAEFAVGRDFDDEKIKHIESTLEHREVNGR